MNEPSTAEDNSIPTELFPQERKQDTVSRPIRKYIPILAILFIIGLVIGAGGGILLYAQILDDEETVERTTEETTAAAESALIELDTPTGNTTVGGRIEISGTATISLETIRIRLYDESDMLLGEADVTLSADESSQTVSWSTFLDVTESPAGKTGVLHVFPMNEGEMSELAKEVILSFPVQSQNEDRIKLEAPLNNQLLTDTKVLFRGQMKDFFEGTLGIRLKDESGAVIFSGFITADGNNYGEFAYFEKEVDIGEFPDDVGNSGTWELYETSMRDGSETIFLQVAVRFGVADLDD